MNSRYAIASHVYFLKLFGKPEEVGREFGDFVAPQRDQFHLGQAEEGFVCDPTNLVAVQLELLQADLVLKGPLRDRHNTVVTQVHLDQLGQEPKVRKGKREVSYLIIILIYEDQTIVGLYHHSSKLKAFFVTCL